jgi:hypothetical protein
MNIFCLKERFESKQKENTLSHHCFFLCSKFGELRFGRNTRIFILIESLKVQNFAIIKLFGRNKMSTDSTKRIPSPWYSIVIPILQ